MKINDSILAGSNSPLERGVRSAFKNFFVKRTFEEF
jgi:hypothetical protein